MTRINNIEVADMSDKEFVKLSTFIYSNYGIKMPPAKKVMLQSRLLKRLRDLDLTSFKDYIDFAFKKENEAVEIVNMIDIVSTNKTDFFREPVHFKYINEELLPNMESKNHFNKIFKIWSAGSSSGEEAYSIAMTMEEWANNNMDFKYQIRGSDISTKMLKNAADAIYKEERIIGIPESLKKKYFLRSKDKSKKMVRIVPELRSKTSFFRLNFMDNHYHIKEMFDIIFCRNTLIYFDKATQENVLNKLCMQLKNGGYLFIGHSESILNRDFPLKQIKPTIYIKE